MMNVNYRQQTPSHLGFYSSSIKGWITQDITLGQDINIKPFPFIHALQDFKVSTMNLQVVEEWNSLKQITIFLQSSQLEKHLRFLKTKHSLPSPFMVLSNHSVYMVFLDTHQGIDDFAFFLSTSKSLCGAQVEMHMKTYLHCIYSKVKTRIQGEKCHTLRSRCACVWICIWQLS